MEAIPMTILKAVILGVVQGLTEFLPVSSSGHLVLFQNLLGMKEPMLAFDIVLHLGTLVAVFIYFRKDFFEMIRQSFLFIVHLPRAADRQALFEKYPYALESSFVILSCIPTAVIGFVFKDAFEALFGSVLAVGVAWIVMSGILIASRWFQNGIRGLELMNHQDAFLIGLAQGVSIIPGISRSGSTILAAMLCGIEKKEAARFSFWMSVPAIIGAAAFELDEGLDFFAASPWTLAAGFIASAVVGYLTISFLLKLMQRGRFYLFGYYCLAVGLFTVIYFSVPR